MLYPIAKVHGDWRHVHKIYNGLLHINGEKVPLDNITTITSELRFPDTTRII